MILKKIRHKIGTRKSHEKVIGTGASQFLSDLEKKNEGELLVVRIQSYAREIYLRNKTSDIPTFYQCIFHEEYDIQLDFTPEVIVDLGANIGLTSSFFKNKYPNSTILAVEPEPSNFEIMKKNLSSYDGVRLVQAGIWDKDTNLIVEDAGLGHYGFTVKEVESPQENSMKGVCLETLLSENSIQRIDILKIDIEGSEKELFRFGTQDWLPKVKVLIIELHDRFKPGCAQTFFKAISDYNYRLEIKGENIIIYFQD